VVSRTQKYAVTWSRMLDICQKMKMVFSTWFAFDIGSDILSMTQLITLS
jgi:hypothetical protein